MLTFAFTSAAMIVSAAAQRANLKFAPSALDLLPSEARTERVQGRGFIADRASLFQRADAPVGRPANPLARSLANNNKLLKLKSNLYNVAIAERQHLEKSYLTVSFGLFVRESSLGPRRSSLAGLDVVAVRLLRNSKDYFPFNY